MKMKKNIFLLLFVVLGATGLVAQTKGPSLMGSDFWVGFVPGHTYDLSSYHDTLPFEHRLLIASESGCIAYVECLSPDYDTTVTVLPGQITEVLLPNDERNPQYHSIQYDHGFHVTTTAPAVVYAAKTNRDWNEITAILPTSTLGNDYMVQSFGVRESVCILALHDNTEVQIIGGNDSFYAGDTLNVILQAGEAFYRNEEDAIGISYWNPNIDNSGTRIHSSRPVAVFQGNRGQGLPYILSGSGNWSYHSNTDILYEQAFPIGSWGQRFMVITTTGRSNGNWDGGHVGDVVKVTAAEDNCVVDILGQQVATLAAGESYTFLMANHPIWVDYYPLVPPFVNQYDFYQSEALLVETSKPATVCYYITGGEFGGNPGSPASVIVPPLEQCVSHAVAASAYNSSVVAHYVNIVAPTTDVPLVTLDGQSISASFQATPGGYSWARIAVDTGPHVIDALSGQFQATIYGLGNNKSYAYITGTAIHNFTYNVWVDRHDLCLGDTATVIVSRDTSLFHTTWQIDGQPFGTDVDTIYFATDSLGEHHLRFVINPLGDTVWETIVVHPAYYSLHFDTLCPGESLSWQGRTLEATGLYADSLLSIDGCDSIGALQLTVLDAPRADFVLDTDCAHYCYHIFGFSEGDTVGHRMLWQATPPDAALEGQPWDSLSLSPTQTTTYGFNTIDRCPSDTSFTLQPIRWPQAQMMVRPEQLSIDHPDFVAYDQSINADGRQWWVDGWLAGDAPQLHYTADMTADSLMLTLVAFNETCADTVRRTLNISHAAVWVPNVFTPDEATNNRFHVVLNESVAEELYIYNRYGLLVAHIVGPDPRWDGTSNGSPCQQGAYTWLLRYRRDDSPNALQTLIGTVTLLR